MQALGFQRAGGDDREQASGRSELGDQQGIGGTGHGRQVKALAGFGHGKGAERSEGGRRGHGGLRRKGRDYTERLSIHFRVMLTRRPILPAFMTSATDSDFDAATWLLALNPVSGGGKGLAARPASNAPLRSWGSGALRW